MVSSIISRISQSISSQNCIDPKSAAKNAELLEKLLGIAMGTINWRLSVNYEYDNPAPPLQSSISTLYNQVDMLPDYIERDSYSIKFQQNKWATCHVKDGKIMSACHSYNRAISIETRPKYRRRGFGKACLLRIAKELISDGLRPAYGTGYGNIHHEKLPYLRDLSWCATNTELKYRPTAVARCQKKYEKSLSINYGKKTA